MTPESQLLILLDTSPISTAAKGQKIQITSTRKKTSSDIYQNLADNVRNMNLDDAILDYFYKMCERGQK